MCKVREKGVLSTASNRMDGGATDQGESPPNVHQDRKTIFGRWDVTRLEYPRLGTMLWHKRAQQKRSSASHAEFDAAFLIYTYAGRVKELSANMCPVFRQVHRSTSDPSGCRYLENVTNGNILQWWGNAPVLEIYVHRWLPRTRNRNSGLVDQMF